MTEDFIGSVMAEDIARLEIPEKCRGCGEPADLTYCSIECFGKVVHERQEVREDCLETGRHLELGRGEACPKCGWSIYEWI